ncbi:MAG TPA: hypothetical protein VFT29_13590 [Gemmatimonadaceae bacterium]|nr:hypothetical protein [Gemmatimonadaceae bacterium]
MIRYIFVALAIVFTLLLDPPLAGREPEVVALFGLSPLPEGLNFNR